MDSLFTHWFKTNLIHLKISEKVNELQLYIWCLKKKDCFLFKNNNQLVYNLKNYLRLN